MGPGVLSGVQPPRPDHRHAQQPGWQHRFLDPQASPAQGVVLLATPRRALDLEHAVRVPRSRGGDLQRTHRQRWEAFTEGSNGSALAKSLARGPGAARIWLSAQRWLVDSGMASAAEVEFTDRGAWLIEGHGVDPDVVVDNLPHETFDGRDAQLKPPSWNSKPASPQIRGPFRQHPNIRTSASRSRRHKGLCAHPELRWLKTTSSDSSNRSPPCWRRCWRGDRRAGVRGRGTRSDG